MSLNHARLLSFLIRLTRPVVFHQKNQKSTALFQKDVSKGFYICEKKNANLCKSIIKLI